MSVHITVRPVPWQGKRGGCRQVRRLAGARALSASNLNGGQSDMWHRARQNFNVAGLVYALRVLSGEQYLALPHLEAPDVRWLNWAAFREAGFRGIVFDKDNTLTAPYATCLYPGLAASVSSATTTFGPRKVVAFSNSAGLRQFDPDGNQAAALEATLGLPVLRHGDAQSTPLLPVLTGVATDAKKPGGGPEALEAHFGCSAAELVLVGDRYLTDIVFGNRHGMLTVKVAPLVAYGEPPAVLVARAVENALVARWRAGSRASSWLWDAPAWAGLMPDPHPLHTAALKGVRGASLSEDFAPFVRSPTGS